MPAPNVSIVIGNITPDDQSAHYIPDVGDDVVVWTDYVVHNHYKRNRSRYVLGVTAEEGFNGDTAAFVQLSKGYLIWICDWSVEKIGESPDIPNPTPQDNRWRLLSDSLQANDVELNPDGESVTYRISGTYIYGNKKPDDNTFSEVDYPIPPWINPDVVDDSDLTNDDLDDIVGAK